MAWWTINPTKGGAENAYQEHPDRIEARKPCFLPTVILSAANRAVIELPDGHMTNNAAYDLQNIQAYLQPDSRGLLVGVYSCSIDRRGRIAIPKDLREVFLSGGFKELGIYMSDGDHLAVMPVTRERDATGPFMAVADSGIASITIRQLTHRGALTIPEALRLDADLSGTVLCRGMGWKLELWNPLRYDAHMRRARLRLEQPPGEVPCAREITLRP